MRYAIVVLAVAFAGMHGNAAAARATPPEIRATIGADSPLFGDAFEYVVVARARADESGAVTVVAPVGPFAQLAPPRTTKTTTAGGLTVVEFRQTLACLAIACVPDAAGKRVVLPPAAVVIDGASTSAPSVAVVLRPRVTAKAVAANEPRFERPSRLPTPTMRIPAGVLAAVLTVGGVALIVGSITISLMRAAAGRRSPGVRVDPIARAVRLLRESSGRTAPDRRRAASLASRVVAEEPLRRDAERVAWAPPIPGPTEAEGLADRVERAAEVSS